MSLRAAQTLFRVLCVRLRRNSLTAVLVDSGGSETPYAESSRCPNLPEFSAWRLSRVRRQHWNVIRALGHAITNLVQLLARNRGLKWTKGRCQKRPKGHPFPPSVLL